MNTPLLLIALLQAAEAPAQASAPVSAPAQASAPVSAPPQASAPVSAPAQASAPVSAPAQASAPVSAPAQATAPASAEATSEPDDGDGPVRLSLATVEDEEAWRTPGFRLTLGLTGGLAHGLDEKPDGDLLGPLLRVGARLSADWSLLASFHYQATWGELGDLAGLRYLGAVEPVWHIGDQLELALGLGFAGIIEGFSGRPGPGAAQRDSLNSSYTLPAGSLPVEACQGTGVAGTLRGAWTLILGPRSATGLSLEVDAQYTACVEETGRVEPDTARPIARRQWWPHLATTVAWSFTWR